LSENGGAPTKESSMFESTENQFAVFGHPIEHSLSPRCSATLGLRSADTWFAKWFSRSITAHLTAHFLPVCG
jgi:hypothetical protein